MILTGQSQPVCGRVTLLILSFENEGSQSRLASESEWVCLGGSLRCLSYLGVSEKFPLAL